MEKCVLENKPNFVPGKKKFVANAAFGVLSSPAATSQDDNHHDDRYHNNNQYFLRTKQHRRYHIVHYHISHESSQEGAIIPNCACGVKTFAKTSTHSYLHAFAGVYCDVLVECNDDSVSLLL